MAIFFRTVFFLSCVYPDLEIESNACDDSESPEGAFGGNREIQSWPGFATRFGR